MRGMRFSSINGLMPDYSDLEDVMDALAVARSAQNNSWLFPKRSIKSLNGSTISQRFSSCPRLKKERLKEQRIELRDAEIDRWLLSKGRFPETRWSVKERRSLKAWFDQLDTDGSGGIDVEELSDPLLSTGIAKSVTEVRELVRTVDEDYSGEIGFSEFLAVLKPQQKKKIKNSLHSAPDSLGSSDAVALNIMKHRAVNEESDELRRMSSNPIVKLQAIQRQSGGMDINSVLAITRRALLLDKIMGEEAREERAVDDRNQYSKRRNKKQENDGDAYMIVMKKIVKRSLEHEVAAESFSRLKVESPQFVTSFKARDTHTLHNMT